MKRCLMLLCAFAGLSLRAAEWTVSEPTTLTENKSAGDIYVNAELTLPEGKTLTIDSSKVLYLPGSAGFDATLKVEKGDVKYGNNSSKILIGQWGGKGYIDVDGNYDFNAAWVSIGGNAVKSESGYVEMMRIANGAAADGNWYRVYCKKFHNYRKEFARIRFDRPGGTLACSGTENGWLFSGDAGSGFAFEGVNGADVIFGIGSWWTSSMEKYLLAFGSKSKFKTLGSCDVVFHNHNNAEYKAFIVAADTNQYIWAHSGKTIVSNGCVLKVTADYALPNGAQTGILEFRGKANESRVRPVIDLMGTTQIVNGINDATSHTTGAVTNGAATTAALVFGAHGEDTLLKVGNLYENIEIKKTGGGSMRVEGTAFHGNDITIEGGVLTLANGSAGVNAGAVAVNAGKLVIDGCTLDCTSIRTTESGKIVCRNGGHISGADVKGVTVEVESCAFRYAIDSSDYTAEVGYGQIEGASGSGAVSLVKSGEHLLTYSPKGISFDRVDVQEGTLRVGGELVSDKYWRFSFTKAEPANGTWTLQFKNPQTSAYDVDHTFVPCFGLNRLHLWGADPTVHVNSSIAYQGKDVAVSSLSEDCVTDDAFGIDANGLGGGGQLRDAHQLFEGMTQWFRGSAWTNVTLVSSEHPLAITFRLKDARKPASGYAMSRLSNTDRCRPLSWKVYSSADGLTWTLRDEKTDTEGVGGSKVYGNDTVPFLFSKLSANWSFRPTGAVRVAAGATLDTSEIPDANISISRLEADAATGAGTITKFVPAASGTLNLVNVSTSFVRIPVFTVGAIVGKENLKNWKVSFDGVERADYRVKLNSRNQLCVSKFTGLFLVVE